MALAMEPRSVDNDTRGWIMCIISGIGMFNLSMPCNDGLKMMLIKANNSLRCRSFNHMRRCHCPTLPREAQLPHLGKQWLPRWVPESELRCHGKFCAAVISLSAR
jgi:hypothetical protein